MKEVIHKIYAITIYNGKQILYRADTSETMCGAKFEYNLIDIKNKTGKWPTKITFMEIEKIKGKGE